MDFLVADAIVGEPPEYQDVLTGEISPSKGQKRMKVKGISLLVGGTALAVASVGAIVMYANNGVLDLGVFKLAIEATQNETVGLVFAGAAGTFIGATAGLRGGMILHYLKDLKARLKELSPHDANALPARGRVYSDRNCGMEN